MGTVQQRVAEAAREGEPRVDPRKGMEGYGEEGEEGALSGCIKWSQDVSDGTDITGN
jgi:hypothetical protein